MSFLKPLTAFVKSQLARGQFTFFAMAVLMLALVSIFVIFNLTFLFSNLNKALSVSTKPASPPRFDIEAFEKLNLIRKQ